MLKNSLIAIFYTIYNTYKQRLVNEIYHFTSITRDLI